MPIAGPGGSPQVRARQLGDISTSLFIPEQRTSAHPIRPAHVNAMIDLHPGGLIWRRVFPGTSDQIPRARHRPQGLGDDPPGAHEPRTLFLTPAGRRDQEEAPWTADPASSSISRKSGRFSRHSGTSMELSTEISFFSS